MGYTTADVHEAKNCLTLLKQKMKNVPACERFYTETRAPARNSTNTASRTAAAPAMKSSTPPASRPVVPVSQYDASVNDANDAYDQEPRIQCPTCSRSFIESSYEKHQRVCEKVFVKKRNAFDSTAMRLDGREDAAVALKKIKDEKRAAERSAAAKKPSAAKDDKGAVKAWKIKSLQFQASIGNAEAAAELKALDVQGALQKGSGQIQCQYCGRSFSEEAGKRHIPVCETNAMKARVTGKNHGPALLKKGGGIQASANVKRK